MEDTSNQTTPDGLADERKMLMDRARVMGLKVSPNIGLETLREKIKSALENNKRPSDDEDDENQEGDPEFRDLSASLAQRQPVKETENQKRSRLKKTAERLVRIRITCLNPQKKDLPGEIFTVGNRYIGTIRKFVPFGDATQNGYHVPYCIYEHLKERRFLSIQTKPTKNGTETVKTQDAPEFAIEVLPQLTPKELQKLAMQQAMASGTADV